MKKYILTLILLIITGCSSQLDTFGMPHPPQEGPPAYLEGWNDGCQTGMATYGSTYTRTKYKTQFDGYKMNDPLYRRGWELAQSYCSYYISTYLSNTELSSTDLREKNTWFSLEGDGTFSYSGWEHF